MKAFLSYSLNDSEQYVLSILAQTLQGQGFVVSTSYNLLSHSMDFATFSQLNQSNLFIGLITASGNANERVFSEWQQASANRTPSILLVENTVRVNPEFLGNPNVVLFNRHDPNPALDFIRQQISASRAVVVPQNNSNTAGWIFGGLAALAIIGLLASKSED